MKILLLTQWFDPEPCLKGLAFAQELRRRGHAVSVLTGFPNYPDGKLYPGYRVAVCRREWMDGIAVLRVPLYPSRDRSLLRRMFNYASFALSSAFFIPALPRPDIVYAYSPPPTAALGAVCLLALRRVPFVLDVQDLWPDALEATGMVRASALRHIIGQFVDHLYRKASRIAVLSAGYKQRLIARGIAPERIVVIPNWTHEHAPTHAPPPPRSDDTFRIVFAGNFGPAQQLDIVLDAARLLARSAPQVRFILAGDGIDGAALRAEAKAIDTVDVVGRLALDDMPALFASADALLVHLRNEPAFAITIPSKTQAYLHAGKPILMGVRGDAADMIARAGAGLCFPPGSAEALADAVLRLVCLPEDVRGAMGRAGQQHYREHLSIEAGTRAFAQLFEQVIAEGQTGVQRAR